MHPLLDRCAVVMAHPDDEVLWASAVLGRAGRIVLCFGEVASKPALGAGRRRAMAAFPLPGAVHLDLAESEVFGGADWPLPEETPAGLAVRRRPGAMAGFSQARYEANQARLAGLLTERLRGCADVVTHNPWGEYGHEEHVQVLRAVAAAQASLGFRIWVTGYCSDKSAPLMRRHLARLGPPTPPLPTDPALGDRLRRLYQETGCWTWFDDYVWPETEVFYPWPAGAGTGAETAPPPRPGAVHPLNHVWLGWTKPPPPAPLPVRLARRLARPLRRRFATTGAKPR
ncbi:hypothetical protein BH23PSE1_BH23PSE1_02480 [soil metagenome]